MKLTLLILLFSVTTASATHLKGGYISIEKHSGLTYRIVITVYTNNVNTQVLFGGDGSFLSFGDGTEQAVPEQQNAIENGLLMARFEVLHTYPGHGAYKVVYEEPNRNEGIVNLTNSVATPMVLESYFVSDPSIPYAGSPVFIRHPFFTTPFDDDFSMNIGASSNDDTHLFYQLTTPARADDYFIPENFFINQYNGTITWDTRVAGVHIPGEFVFNVKISQVYNGTTIGYTVLDLMIAVYEGESSIDVGHDQETDNNNRIYVPPGSERTFRAFIEGASGLTVDALAPYSGTSAEEIYTVDEYDSSANGKAIKVLVFTCFHDGAAQSTVPDLVTVRGKADNGNGVVQYKDIAFMLYTEDTDVAGQITGNEERASSELAVYPNPYSNHVSVSVPDGTPGHLILRSTDNRVLFNGTVRNGDTIPLATPSDPVIIYQLITGKKTVTGKLLRE